MMNLESIIQMEVSQKDKNKYHTLTHIYGIQKNSTDEPICREGMEMQMQRADLWPQRGKKKVGWIKKVEFCTYTMMCEIDRLWEVAA